MFKIEILKYSKERKILLFFITEVFTCLPSISDFI